MRESHDEVNEVADVIEELEVGDVKEECCFDPVIWGSNLLHDDHIEALFKFWSPLNQDIDKEHQ